MRCFKRNLEVIRNLFLLSGVIFLLSACEVEVTYFPKVGFVNGKVIDCQNSVCYTLDLGSVYSPEDDSLLFIVAAGSTDEKGQEDWLVEAECRQNEFIRGIGSTAFNVWPEEFALKAVELACSVPNTPSFPLEHPMSTLTKEERENFIYSFEFTEKEADMLVKGVKYWAQRRAEYFDSNELNN